MKSIYLKIVFVVWAVIGGLVFFYAFPDTGFTLDERRYQIAPIQVSDGMDVADISVLAGSGQVFYAWMPLDKTGGINHSYFCESLARCFVISWITKGPQAGQIDVYHADLRRLPAKSEDAFAANVFRTVGFTKMGEEDAQGVLAAYASGNAFGSGVGFAVSAVISMFLLFYFFAYRFEHIISFVFMSSAVALTVIIYGYAVFFLPSAVISLAVFHIFVLASLCFGGLALALIWHLSQRPAAVSPLDRIHIGS